MTSDAQQAIDSRAIELATQAVTRIEMHERRCEERDRAIAHGLERIHARLDAMATRWLAGLGAIILVLLAAVGWLMQRALPWSG